MHRHGINGQTGGPRFEETALWIEEMSTKAGFPLKSKGAVS
jgi:uncharacterized protein